MIPGVPVCLPFSRQSDSTSGGSRWVCTKASPARPINRVKLSAVTRTTRSRSAIGNSRVRHRPLLTLIFVGPRERE